MGFDKVTGVKVTGVLLAAGLSTRFGGNKLESLLRGEMLGLHAARTLAGLGLEKLIAVCNPASAPLNEALKPLGFHLKYNERPDAGLSSSLKIAVEEASGAGALLIILADMPNVTQAHFAALLEAYNDTCCVASSLIGQRMPPVLIPCSLFPELMSATGDAGARNLLRAGIAVEGSAEMLADVDTRADLALRQG